MASFEETMDFRRRAEKSANAEEILLAVYHALKEKGYDPINQLVGYLLSGDPAYITSHHDARNLIRHLERDELIEELLRHYLQSRV